MKSPENWIDVKRLLKKMAPKMIVKTGVKLFSIPVYPEDNPCSAYVKRNAGKKFPNNPTPKIEKKNLKEVIFFKL